MKLEKLVLCNSGLNNVKLNDMYLINAAEKDIKYLLSLESNKFLHHFYNIAGLVPPADGYGGWEGYNGNSYWNFRGHMFGHYMSALSQAYRANQFGNKNELLKKIKDAINGLKECQDAYAEKNPDGAGYISAFPEVDLDIVQETADAAQRTVWVPWYNLHKVLAGLINIYRNVKDDKIGETALEIASLFGEYIYNRTLKLTDKNTLLSTEYGGMNDALYELYNITGSVVHRKAAECFDETNLFIQLKNNNDVLSGKHANTTIPKFIGALKRYTVLTQNEEYYNILTKNEQLELEDYFIAAENFWNIVVSSHSYITGGNSQGEHFHKPNSLGQCVHSEKTCETCNTYNMLKLTEELYKVTGDKKYADFYENTFINSILSSQNPHTGMMTYFQPMGAGYNKVYNKEFEHFYCCTGTGIESFSKLNSSIYYVDNANNVYVNMYFSSEFEYGNIILKQESNVPNEDVIKFTFKTKSGFAFDDFKLFLRIPDWSGVPVVTINGKIIDYFKINGYIQIQDIAKDDVIELKLPIKTAVYELPDTPEIIAFKYGPVVLSTGLGKNNLYNTGTDGVNVRISVLDKEAPQTIDLSKNIKIDTWKTGIQNNLIRIEDSENGMVQFKLRGTVSEFIFTPHFMQHDERYGLYMTLAETDGEENN